MTHDSDYEERLEWVQEHLGYATSAYREYQEKFGKSYGQFYKDRNEVLQRMEERLGKRAEEWAKDLLIRYEKLYQMALERKRVSDANQILQSISKLMGLDVQKVEVKSDQKVELDWGVEEDGD